jgi:RNA polymerase sigma-70 factor (ECF subfamily)
VFQFSGSRKKIKSEKDVIEAYQRMGDIELIGTLYDKNIHLVYGVCLKYLKNREDSKDAVMQIFEKILIDLKNTQVEHFQSWLYVVARNYCLMQLRKKTIQVDIQTAEENSSEIFMENPGELHLNNENVFEKNSKKLRKCLEKLSEQQKSCIELFYLEEKCYKEISEITQFDLKKVKSYIQNGKRNLKNCLEDNYGRKGNPI